MSDYRERLMAEGINDLGASAPPYIVCPHIIEHPAKKDGEEPKSALCGLDVRGQGRRTRITLPTQHFDGNDFIVTCPRCSNDILVESRMSNQDLAS